MFWGSPLSSDKVTLAFFLGSKYMMCCRLMPCKNGKNVYIYKNTKLAEGTVADVSAQMFENVVYSDLK